MAMTYKFGGGFGKLGWLVRYWFGRYFCCGVCATIFGIGCGTVGSCRNVFGKWKGCWRSGFADTVLACLFEVLGGCGNSNSPVSGNSYSFAIFWGLLLDGIFLFWVTFVFFFPQSLSRLPLLEFISTCSVVDFAFRFEISVLNTFNLLTITMLWQHALNDLYRTQDLLRHVSQFTRVSYSTGTGFRNKVKIYVWCDYSRRWLVIAAVCGTTACIYRNFKTVEFTIWPESFKKM